MANQNRGPQGGSRGMQTQQQGRNSQNQMTDRSGSQQNNPDAYYSYSYGYGYYDPYTDQWVINEYGPFTGMGPVGYQRSDDRISEDICDLLWLNGNIDASNVDVDVKNGVATLKGTVDDRRMKRLAEDLSYSVPGVDDVQNQLRIQQNQNQQLGQGQQQQPSQGQGQTSNRGQQLSQNQGQQNFRSQIKQGMDIVDSQGKKLGTVKEIHDYDFLIDRPMATDVHAPFNSIQNVSGNQVQLNVTANQIDNMHWGTSPKEKTQAR